MRALMTAVASLFVAVASAQVVSETSRDLGFGFREVHREEKMPPTFWEGVGYFGFLYYKDHELCQCSSYSIAPSGRYALFQDATGDIVLFVAATLQRNVAAGFSGSRADHYLWNEAKNEASVAFEDRSNLKVPLGAP